MKVRGKEREISCLIIFTVLYTNLPLVTFNWFLVLLYYHTTSPLDLPSVLSWYVVCVLAGLRFRLTISALVVCSVCTSWS